MSRDTAADVAQFLKNNDISTITIMGGEFFCHPDWESVLEIIISESNAKYVRLVTNGDWAAQKSNETLNAIEPYKDFLKISISEDQWHTNENVTAAADACEKRKFIWNFPTEEQRSVNSIVPVGRGDTYSFSFSAMFSCYCDDPRHKYSFLIDEMGDIFKCAMGVWRYTDVLENLNGGFTQMFRDYNTRFYKNFRPNCKSCYMAYLHRQRQKQE